MPLLGGAGVPFQKNLAVQSFFCFILIINAQKACFQLTTSAFKWLSAFDFFLRRGQIDILSTLS